MAAASIVSRSIAPAVAGGDAYADLIRETRGLRREQQVAREQWLARLDVSSRGGLPRNWAIRCSSSAVLPSERKQRRLLLRPIIPT